MVPAPCDGNNVTFSLSQTDHELRTTHPYVEQSQTTMSEAQTFRVMFLWKYYYITWGIMRILKFIYFDWYISVHNANWMKFNLHSFWNVVTAYIKLEVNYILLRYILEWHYNTVAYIFEKDPQYQKYDQYLHVCIFCHVKKDFFHSINYCWKEHTLIVIGNKISSDFRKIHCKLIVTTNTCSRCSQFLQQETDINQAVIRWSSFLQYLANILYHPF